MKGTNELHLNEDTVKEIFQFWLNENLKNAPTVKEIKRGDIYHRAGSLIVVLDGDREGSEKKEKEASHELSLD